MASHTTGEHRPLSRHQSSPELSSAPSIVIKGLLGLPPELLQTIFDTFSAPSSYCAKGPAGQWTGTGTLYSLALTCRSLLSVARTSLYRNIVLSQLFKLDINGGPHLLARTVCEKPSIGSMIRTIISMPCAMTDSMERDLEGAIEDVLTPLCGLSVAFRNVSKASKRRCCHADLAVILLRATRLTTLSVMTARHWQCQREIHSRSPTHESSTELLVGFFSALRRPQIRAKLGPKILSTLHHLDISGHNETMEEVQVYSSTLLGAVGILPALNTLHGRGVVDYPIDNWLGVGQSNTITTLSLVKASIRDNTMCGVIENCSELRTFDYVMEGAGFDMGMPVQD